MHNLYQHPIRLTQLYLKLRGKMGLALWGSNEFYICLTPVLPQLSPAHENHTF